MTREDWPTTAAGSPPSSSKDDGKRAFIESRFSDALGHYLTAIDQLIFTSSSSSEGASASSSEHQILLSNVVACRLKIGGTDMIEKAVGEAKKVRIICRIFEFVCNIREMISYHSWSVFMIRPPRECGDEQIYLLAVMIPSVLSSVSVVLDLTD
jgi:hypothetical protein